jgi:hypothetical protein
MKIHVVVAACCTILCLVSVFAPFRGACAEAKVPANRTVFLERTSADNVDLGTPGTSVGDLRVTRGVVRATQDGEVIGSYATSQVTVATGLEGGNEQRSIIMEITIGRSDITMVSMYVVPVGAPPTERVVHPITGGTGRFLGARGSLTLIPIDGAGYRAVLKFV